MVCEWLVSFNNWKYRNRYINSWQIISTKERENTQRIAKVSVRAYVLLYAHTNGSWAIAYRPSRMSCRLEFFVIIDAPHITQRLVYNVHIAIGFDYFKKLFSCSSVGLIPKELPCGLHYNNKNVCLNTSLVNDSKCMCIIFFLLWPSTSRFFVTITFLCYPNAPDVRYVD